MIPPVLMGTNCLIINNTKTTSEVTDQSLIDKVASVKNIKHKPTLVDNVPPFQLQDTCAIDDISEDSQEINEKENT